MRLKKAAKSNDRHGDRYDIHIPIGRNGPTKASQLVKWTRFGVPCQSEFEFWFHPSVSCPRLLTDWLSANSSRRAMAMSSGPFGIHRSISSVIHYNPKSITYESMPFQSQPNEPIGVVLLPLLLLGYRSRPGDNGNCRAWSEREASESLKLIPPWVREGQAVIRAPITN